jgi:uncharacterized membrane protein
MSPFSGLSRWLSHMWIGPAHVRRAITRADFLAIEQAITAGETRHHAELRFAVESSLDTRELWRGVQARERALDVFSHFRMWDTEDDNGVLIYLLWADHAVEVVVDRGVAARVDTSVWENACDVLTRACAEGRAAQGVIEAIGMINDELARAYPGVGPHGNPNELPNATIFPR